MYSLEVYFPDERRPHHIERRESAADLVFRIQALLEEHSGCQKIVVMNEGTRLFSVDCHGNTTSG
jgi:hypothetical protein